MYVKKLIAVCAAVAAGALLAATLAFAAGGSKVTVRIEGAKRTLLAPHQVQTHGGWITKAGTPRGACPATSGTGALDVATHHRWGGTYDKSIGLEITSILGERHTFSSRYFWEIFIDNRAASVGACGLKLHSGDQLLFAAVPIKGSVEHPIAIKAPKTATAGHAFTVKVVWLNGKHTRALADATLHLGKQSAKTNAHGLAQVTSQTPGTVVLRATHKGYVRSLPVQVRVS
jgi:hypothetical protein